MATATAEPPAREPYHIKLYNVPQRVEGGIKIYGYQKEKTGEKVVLYFDHLDGMYANCRIDDTTDTVHLKATTPLVEYKDGYRIESEPNKADEDVANA